MALITLPQTITKGTAFTVTLSKSDLFGLSCVLSHPHFGLQANVSKCIITYTANIPGAEIPETKILQFDLSENSPTASMYVSTHGMDTFTISEILIVDKDGGGLDVPAAQIPSGTDVSFLYLSVTSSAGTIDNTRPTISGIATPFVVVTITDGTHTGTVISVGDSSWSFQVPSAWGWSNQNSYTVTTSIVGASPVVQNFNVLSSFVTIATSGTVTTLTPTISGTTTNNTLVTLTSGSHSGTTTSNGSGAWSYSVPSSWSLSDDTTYTISAAVVGASASTSITTELRYVSITTSGGTITTLTPSLSGTATRNSTVTISDGTHSATVTASSSGAWSYSVSGSWGWADVTSFTVTASVSGATQASVSLTTELRYVTISTTGTLTTKTPTISGTATRNSTVTITQGSNSDTTTATSSGSWSYTVPSGWNLPNLTNVTFGAAVSGATSASKSLATNYPFVTIATSGTVTSLTPVITGTSNASVSVTVSDGTHSGTATSDGSGNWSFTVPGSWSWTDVTSFSVTASYSGASASTSITTELRYVTISTAAGTITTLTPSLSGTATRNSTVTISDGTNSATVTATSGNSWSYSVPGTWGWVDVTAYTVTASVSGATSASVAFTTELRYVTISTSGTQNTATPTLTGTATRNSTVTITQGSNSATVTATSGGSWSYTVPSGWNLPNLTNVTFGAAVSGATSASATLYMQYQSAFLVAATGAGVIIKRGSGNYVAWGINGSGDLGNGTTTGVTRPTAVSYSKDFDSIKGSSNEYTYSGSYLNGTVGIESGTGYAYGWGKNNYGDLGTSNDTPKLSPAAASGTHQFSQISYGLGSNITNSASFYALAIEKTTGALYSWGTIDNYTGSLARTTYGYWTPMLASNASSIAFKKVYAGGRALGISTAGALYMWGGGSSGSNNTPVLIDNSRVYNDIAATEPGITPSNMACFALDSTGTIYSWSPSGCTNPSGVLGNGSSSTQSTPTAIGGSKKFSQIATGREFVAAIEVGTNNLYTWGLNNYGQLGDGTLYTRFSPTLIGSRQWASVSCGDYFMVAVELGTNDVYTWGYGAGNRLGNGSSSNVLVPTKITMP
jgi:Regulator of chromosome condensation (RCC1) repeat